MLCVKSGKLVMKMFQKIQELVDDPDALVCVLIDEVCHPVFCLGCVFAFSMHDC